MNNARVAAGGMAGGATLMNMGRAMLSAHSDAKAAGQQKSIESNPASMGNQLQSQANAVRASKASGNADKPMGRGPVDMTKTPQSH